MANSIDLRLRAVMIVAASCAMSRCAEPAGIRFRCGASAGRECAFYVEHPSGSTTYFLVAAGNTFDLSEHYKDGRYCVVVGETSPPQDVWPQCWSETGQRRAAAGKINE